MVLLAFLTLALAGVAPAAVVGSLTLSRLRVAEHLADVAAYGYAAALPALSGQSTGERDGAVTSLAGRLGDVVARRLGGVREGELRKVLMAAGMYSVSPRTVLGYRMLVTALLFGSGLLVGGNLAVRVVAAGVLAALGWVLSMMYLRRRAGQRALEIERETPNLIDQLVVSLEAGVGFSAALHNAAHRLDGPLAEEMRLALQEQ